MNFKHKPTLSLQFCTVLMLLWDVPWNNVCCDLRLIELEKRKTIFFKSFTKQNIYIYIYNIDLKKQFLA